MHNWASALAPTHFLSLVTNADDTAPRNNIHRIEWMNRNLYAFSGGVDRNLIGSLWQKRPEKRLRGFGTIEHIESNIHAHILIKAHCDFELSELQFHVEKQWSNLMPAGSIDLKLISNLSGCVEYVFKDVFQGNFCERLVEIAPV
jgi:hypothetical protein